MHVYACGFLHSRHVHHPVDEHLLALNSVCTKGIYCCYILGLHSSHNSVLFCQRWKVWPLRHYSLLLHSGVTEPDFIFLFFPDKPAKLDKVTVHRPVTQPVPGILLVSPSLEFLPHPHTPAHGGVYLTYGERSV